MKLVRNGKVAVLYSPGFGAGWFTWNTEHPDMLTDRDLALAVEEGDVDAQHRIASEKWPEAYKGGLPLKIAWVDEGQSFRVEEYDGNESVVLSYDWMTA